MMNIVMTVDNTFGKILSPLTIGQLEVLSSQCSFEVPGSDFKSGALYRRTSGRANWDGYSRLFNIRDQSFPIGLLPRIRSIFEGAGYTADIIDNRIHMPNKWGSFIASNYDDRPYQKGCVISSAINGGGIVKVATGGGKTTIAALTIEAICKPTVFIVHTKDLLYQAKESFERIFGIEIGQVGDGKAILKPITVATVQTLALAANCIWNNYNFDEDFYTNEMISMEQPDKMRVRKWAAHDVGMVMFDEVQRVASRTAYAARALFRHADHTFGYSASPWRDDGCDLLIEAAFGPRIVDISASQLIREGYLVRPTIEIRRVPGNVWSGRTYDQIYKSAVVENVFRNMLVVSDAIRHYKDGRCTLVLVTQIKHGEILEKMMRGSGVPAQFISGMSGMRYRKQVIDDMRKGKAPLIIATTIADVGLDVPRISAMVEAGAGKSSVTALQRVGREMRIFDNKTDCVFSTYRDTAPYLCNQIDNKIKIWQTEPEFIIREVG